MLSPTFLTLLSALAGITDAAPALTSLAGSDYAPVASICPYTPLVRTASGINSNEQSYVTTRHANAQSSITSFLKANGVSATKAPVIALLSSGGGLRSLLCSAGVVQAFDERDSNASVAGVYQALTYQAGLSGGSWFLSSMAGNNWPTITYLRTTLWEQAFQNSLLVPANLLSTSGATEYAAVSADIAAKKAAGYNVTIVDPYGRLLSYQLLTGTDGGVQDTLSGLTALSNFTTHSVPYPIITTTIDFPAEGQCGPSFTGPLFEFHPYEYGSWDKGVDAFAVTSYMGSVLSNGKPKTTGSCVTNYDNLGYVFGTSSDVFNDVGGGSCFVPANDTTDVLGVFAGIIEPVQTLTTQALFALYPNPFYKYKPSSMVKNLTTLTLSDGGESDQNNPIWPFIQPARNVDLLIVNDNSADTTDNFPNGTEIIQTYENAKKFKLTKMPYIPPLNTFVSEGLNKRATFFGCNQTGTVFIVYLPNVNYTFPSNEPTSKLEYTVAETDGMIANGQLIATQNGTADWSQCLACAIGTKGGAPSSKQCNACFAKYCYYQK